MGDERSRRLGENERLYRAVNEQIRSLDERSGRLRLRESPSCASAATLAAPSGSR